MPCINNKNLIYLKTYNLHDKEIVNIASSVGQKAKSNVPYDFFYIQFSTITSFNIFPIDQIIPSDIIEKIKNKKIFLVLDNALEYFLQSADAIYRDIVIKFNIPAEQIIFLSSVPTMHIYVKELAARLNLPQIKVDWFSLFESTGQDAARSNVVALQKKQKYTKKFLNLNRRWRLHRPLLLTLLKSKNLLQHGSISFAPSDDNETWQNVFPRLQQYYSYHNRITKILNENKSIQEMEPLYLDTHDLVTNRAIHEDTINSYYSSTYFSIVNETTYHEGVPFLSEKIFKTIAMGHPFIMVTTPNSLQYLKKLGYKTYSPLINEEYDNIEDNGDRMLAILDEVERLCNMDKTKLKEWTSKARQIADYNRRWLIKDKQLSKPMNY